jgi:uncharacterized protein (TIGR03905 family)
LEYRYRTKGTCSREIIVDLDHDIVRSVKFIGGCDGNTKGICSLVQGMKAEDVIQRCKGIRCGFKTTSCPDQLAEAISQALNHKSGLN